MRCRDVGLRARLLPALALPASLPLFGSGSSNGQKVVPGEAEREFTMRSPARRGRRRRLGAAAVELAVTAPILFVMVFGMLEGGRALMVQHLLVNAARDGARAAILDGATVAGIQSQVTSYLSGASVPGASVYVSPDPLTLADIGDPVSVNVQVPFDSVNWLPSGFFFGGINLGATVTMRKETAPTPSS